MSDKQL